MLISVIIPTFNRPRELARTLISLTRQTIPPGSFEIIVIDNGSATPVRLPDEVEGTCVCRLLRVEVNQERCGARTMGVEAAQSDCLLFLDDDLEVNAGFVEAHHRAQVEWPGALVAGATILPPERLSSPFVQFRQRLEQDGMPVQRGVTTALATVAGGNMSVARDHYLRLGGFNPDLAGIEDVDFTQRHVDAGGTIVYLPEALAIHWDHALDIRSYYRRTLFAARCSVRLAQHHPTLSSCQERARVNGPVSTEDTWAQTVKKTLKYVLGCRPFVGGLFVGAAVGERFTRGGRLLDWYFSCLIGIAWLHGYRQGLASVLPQHSFPAQERTEARSKS